MDIPLPELLSILERPHVITLDAENFWGDLSISFSRNSKDEGSNALIGIKWKYHTIPSIFLKSIIPNIARHDADWTTITFKKTGEVVVIFHYVTKDVGSNNLKIKIGVISESSLPISRLRLIGDQIIQTTSRKKFRKS